MNLQQAVFEKILDRFTKKSQAVEVIAQLLEVGNNAVYRRIRGESILTPDELTILTKKFNLSLDKLIHPSTDNLVFSYSAMNQKVKDFASYLHGLRENMQPLRKFPNSYIKYAAAEIPLFHYCFFPELIAFKLYTWGKVTWCFDFLDNQPFRFDLIAPMAYEAATQLLESYLAIESTELWSLNVLDNTLNQIEFHTESGSIADHADAILLCEKMRMLVHHLKAMAMAGVKFPLGAKTLEGRSAFHLFHNEMVYTNNTVVVSSDAGKAIFSTLGNPNFLKGMDGQVVEFVEGWFDNIKVKSQPLSRVAEKHRNKYFNQLLQKIEVTKKRLTSG
ncbi:MAG: hypothetical protein AAF960_08665 [Bacteroidota bacterium]